ncbi:MAG: RNA-binding protein [Anaerolineae bacterium]|nr:RNA-binding protein [Anaerolineae bacterium]HXK41431.1 RNA-binding protein [Anaerolineae bacterium]
MESKLYVGNLPYSITEEDLRELFAQAGAVQSVALIKDRDSGRSKGFGFVEMETAEAAQAAITKFNNYEYQGRNLTVNIARPREDRGGSGGGGFRSGPGGGGRPRGGDRDRRGGGRSW